MRIPQIRERLIEIAHTLGNGEIERLANKLTRRPTIKRAMPVSRTMTAELKQEIREYHKAHPGVAQTEIAKLFNVNQGRVSEALRGKCND
ncbi:hypothetical protein [Brucella intermedia]|uniref:hypothetical protein n=1 Tax=Brucella intermedia TaxID=94625 RepID=UPI00158CE478|nr:hypothetical protein [Brucella intermedia]